MTKATSWSYDVYAWEDAGYYKKTICFPGPYEDRPKFDSEEKARDAMNDVIANLPEKYTVHRAETIGFAPLEREKQVMMYPSSGIRTDARW